MNDSIKSYFLDGSPIAKDNLNLDSSLESVLKYFVQNYFLDKDWFNRFLDIFDNKYYNTKNLKKIQLEVEKLMFQSFHSAKYISSSFESFREQIDLPNEKKEIILIYNFFRSFFNKYSIFVEKRKKKTLELEVIFLVVEEDYPFYLFLDCILRHFSHKINNYFSDSFDPINELNFLKNKKYEDDKKDFYLCTYSSFISSITEDLLFHFFLVLQNDLKTKSKIKINMITTYLDSELEDLLEDSPYKEKIKNFKENFNNFINNHEQLNYLIQNNFKTNSLIDPADLTSFFLSVIELAAESEVLSLECIRLKHKKYNIILLSTQIFNLLDYFSPAKFLYLPLLIKPKKYRKIKRDGKIFLEGGYFSKEVNYLNNFISFKRDIVVEQSHNIINNVNFLQDIPLIINEDFLNLILNKKIKDLDFPNLDWSFFLSVIQGKKNPGVKFHVVQEFIRTLIFAIFYKGKPFYFTYFEDARHRLYIRGYPLNFQGNALLRDLFSFYEKTKKQNYDQKFKFFLDEYIKNEKNNLHIENIKNNFDKVLFSSDAHASIFQITGGLVADINLLKLTQVLDVNIEQKKDVYTFILELLLDKIPLDYIKQKYLKFIQLNSNIESTLESLDTFLSLLKETLNRKFVKKHIMPFSYNKSLISMVSSFKKDEFINRYFKSNFKGTKFINDIATKIIKILVDIFNNQFPLVNKLKIFLIKICNLSFLLSENIKVNFNFSFDISSLKQKNCFNFGDSNLFINQYLKTFKDIISLTFSQNYKEVQVKRIQRNIRISNYKKKKVSVNIGLLTSSAFDKINFKKNCLALYPNMAQFLDSILLHGTVTYCRLKKIPLLTVHDCFYTKLEHVFEIRRAYSLFYYLIFSNNILNTFFHNFLDFLKFSNATFLSVLKHFESNKSTFFLDNLNKEEKNSLKKIYSLYIDLLNDIKHFNENFSNLNVIEKLDKSLLKNVNNDILGN
jgi:hypothetical protein